MLIYKIADAAAWRMALLAGRFNGSTDDLRDGFIHLSASSQTRTTLAKHFAGRTDLVIAAVDATRLGASLRWEIARDGEKFPHVYGPLEIEAVAWCRPLPMAADGVHILPPEFI